MNVVKGFFDRLFAVTDAVQIKEFVETPEKVEETAVRYVDPLDSTQKIVALNNNALTKRGIINGIIAVEGGYVNDPNDLGGETNFGITVAVARKHQQMLKRNFNWNGSMRSLTKDMAYTIYELDYWKPLYLDEISSLSIIVADKMFDIGVNMGIGRAAKWLQEILNSMNRRQLDYKDIVADGRLGPKSIEAYRAFVKKRGVKVVERTVIKLLFCQQGSHYLTISQQREANENFMLGWLNRMDHNLSIYMNVIENKK